MSPESLAAWTMQRIDALPRAVRLLHHEYEMMVVLLYARDGVRNPTLIRTLALAAEAAATAVTRDTHRPTSATSA